MCTLWLIILYLTTIAFGLSNVSIHGLKGCIFATETGWFIKTYFFLYILSPVLNSYVESASRTQFKWLLILFFGFQTVYGWLFPNATRDISGGYSTISFIGLYLLMRYLRIYTPSICNLRRQTIGFLIAFIIIALTCAYVVPPIIGINTTFFGAKAINYVSPSSILLAVLFILYFSKLQLRNAFVNKCAVSCFAVYLLHNVNDTARTFFNEHIVNLHNTYPPLLFWIYTFASLISIYVAAMILDQGRIFLWNKIWPLLEKQYRNIFEI